MLAAILSFLGGLPKILEILREFFVFVGNVFRQAAIDKRNEEMAKATEKAKETKDTTDIDDLFSGRKK